jgi:energy-coupling factor transporter ATP-binding protein EcfA2
VLKSIEIENYKSIVKVKLLLGRVNVFIGENGAGKSNLLEAIALAGAANAGELDNEFLTSRGVRITQPQLMRPAFEGSAESDPIKITVSDNINPPVTYVLKNDNGPYTHWHSTIEQGSIKVEFPIPTHNKEFAKFWLECAARFSTEQRVLSGFVIYSPENSALRIFEREGQIEPLGINGEGLLKVAARSDEAFAIFKIEAVDNTKTSGSFDFDPTHLYVDQSTPEQKAKTAVWDRNRRFVYSDQRFAQNIGVSSAVETTIPEGTKLEINGIAVVPLGINNPSAGPEANQYSFDLV